MTIARGAWRFYYGGMILQRHAFLHTFICRTYVCIQSNGATTVILLIFSDLFSFLLVRVEESSRVIWAQLLPIPNA
jgi:hypothetical protein